jgi:hypothetical protein
MLRKLAYILPKSLMYWVIIRVWADLTTTKYTNKTPDEVTVFMALKQLREG